jgi:hypothetical protein
MNGQYGEPKQRPKVFADSNEQTIADIVAKTGYPVADKSALLEHLLACYDKTFPLFPKQGKSVIRRQQTRWKSMRKAITRLVALIEQDNADLGTVRRITNLWSDALVKSLLNLAAELERREMKPADFMKKNRERYGLGKDEVVMRKLVGEWLPETYERHFKRKARASRPGTGGRPTGPFVRFVQAVLASWKLDYSEEAIKAALRPLKEKK